MPETVNSERSGERPPVASGQAVIEVSARDKDRVLRALDHARQPSASVKRAVDRYKAMIS